jgi:hypothetical protein
MKTNTRMNEKQRSAVLDLLWDYLKQDGQHRDRVRTAWGTKTQEGLIACIERIAYDAETL